MTFSLRRLLLVMAVMALTLGAGLQWAGPVGAISSTVAACALGGILLRWRRDVWADGAGAATFTLLGAALMALGMWSPTLWTRSFGGTRYGDYVVGNLVFGGLLGAIIGGGAYLVVSAFIRFTTRMPRRPPPR